MKTFENYLFEQTSNKDCLTESNNSGRIKNIIQNIDKLAYDVWNRSIKDNSQIKDREYMDAMDTLADYVPFLMSFCSRGKEFARILASNAKDVANGKYDTEYFDKKFDERKYGKDAAQKHIKTLMGKS